MESEIVSTHQKQIAELAKKTKGKPIHSLNQFLTIEWLREAYRRTRKTGAVGVDEVTAEEYEKNLETNLSSLLERMKSGTYKAPPIKRVYIPKTDGSQRPIGIPSLEDKIGQRAILMILECVYEQEFKECSYGFRPGRSAHQALDCIRNQIMDHRTTWVIEADICKFFDSIDRNRLREVLSRRVRDGVVVKLINKWLNAGIMDKGQIHYSTTGTSQGNVLSPILANIVLHEVLDEWFENEVKPRIKGHSFLARFCDDFVMGFEKERDARRVYEVLPKRFNRFGLELHPEKTRMVDFRSPPNRTKPNQRKEFEKKCRKLNTFEFLGFSHVWSASRKGYWIMWQITSKKRFARALKAIKGWCQSNRHGPIKVQHKKLSQKLRGHYSYFGITGNHRRVRNFLHQVERIWLKWLNHRGRGKRLNFEQFKQFLNKYPLPSARLVHKYQNHAAKL